MSKKLFTPGPGNIPQFIRVQLAKDIIHHRMGDYQHVLFEVANKLRRVFQTVEDVLILTTSGTGAMESAIVNFFSKGDEVLVINTGFFGERFIQICKTFALTVHSLDYEWGSTYQLDDVKRVLTEHPNIKGVFVTYHETSTGVVNNLKDLGEFVRHTNALLIADCISGMIHHPFNFDEWHVDCALASSQKGFLLPPGLAFVALSKKAKERMEYATLPKYFWDYSKYLSYYKRGQNPYTPSISLVLALNVALDYLLEKGIDKVIEEKRKLREYSEAKLTEIGFTSFIKDESIKGNVLVPVLTNDVDIDKLVEFLDNRYDISVSKGQGKYADKMLRVGLLSEFTEEDIDNLVEKILEYKAINETE
ncbi:MAG: alanine--glyoxylate aminotransferase family protein [Bacilli bacterium]|nr:alanine--glyoxylate aminotransferase family protein [Bacilli bacterium]